MSDIKLLDATTASKIAAGEVIERPAGVLKELLENSLDAGATAVNVEIEKAGRALIRVNDNGAGIAAADLPKTVLRHATSKINNFADLDNLNTFGFRGEGLFSVAAVSRVSITSAQAGAQGQRIDIEAGKILATAPAPALQGTTVEVRDLFFNTPARLKFLKSDTVERGHLLATAEDAAMANPGVAFNVKTDGVKTYSLPAAKGDAAGLRSRITKILGEESAKTLVFIEDASFGFKAFVSPADKLAAGQGNLFFFVNKRPVNCKILQQAVYKAYQPYRAKDRHPVAVIYLQMPPDSFDVNIHPQKKEIKFSDESAIYTFLTKKISQAILGGGDAPKMQIAPAVAAAQGPAPQAQKLSQTINDNIASNAKPQLFIARDFEEPKAYEISAAEHHQTPVETAKKRPSKEAAGPAWWKPPYSYLGQLHKSYLVFENPLGLVLLDQHAAQERVYFEEYLNSLENNTTEKQPLMFPVSVEMPASAADAITSWEEVLDKAGFEISRFSPRTLLVNTVPNILKFKEADLQDFILSLSGVIGAPGKSDNKLKYKLISTMACKKAVKAGEQLDITQAEALLQNLKKCHDGLHCPHGRPTVITIEEKDITKKFGR